MAVDVIVVPAESCCTLLQLTVEAGAIPAADKDVTVIDTIRAAEIVDLIPFLLTEGMREGARIRLMLLIWLGGFLVYHVATGLIHLVLLLAIILLILHLFRRRHSPA